jgi:ABC-2 type transport system permease protein
LKLLRDASVMLGRRFRLLVRQPIWIAIMLVQPLVWLLLYSQLFARVPELAGAGGGSYLEFLAPGIVVLSAFSHGAWDGSTTVIELEHGIVERFSATPLAPSALLVSQLAQAALTGAGQGLVVLVVAQALGVVVHGGPAGWLAILAAAALVAAAFAGISHTLALLLRRQETVIAVGQFTVLPLTFASVTLVSATLMPHWMRIAAAANPLSWAVEAARAATLTGVDSTSVAVHLGELTILTAATAACALAALARYRRSL